MAILNNSNAISSGGYDINNSLRFRNSATAYLNRTPASSGNRQIFTFSAWVKRGSLGIVGTLLSGGATGGTGTAQFIGFDTNDTFFFSNYNVGNLQTTQVFRDPSAWYHMVVAIDTTQATAANRIKMYVNGSQITAFSSSTYPSQNTNLYININEIQTIGRASWSSLYLFDGYLADVNFIDGQALTPSSFGETDTTTGSWKPKAYTGTYGTNGFYLNFSNTTSTTTLGNDSSGNGNNWTTNNISLTAGVTYDAMTDVPTNTSATTANYAVLNPLDAGTGLTISGGNLNIATTVATSVRQVRASMALPSTGKYYWEAVFTGGADMFNGIGTSSTSLTSSNTGNVYVSQAGDLTVNGSFVTSYGVSYANNDVMGIAVDMDATKIYWYKNGTLINSGGYTFTAGTNTWFPLFGQYNTGNTTSANFGQRPFAQTPPTGYVALNTFNLPTPTILQGNKYMDATTYSGTGASQTVVNAGQFKSDLIWIKQRNSTEWHTLADSIRGTNKQLFSNSTNAEQTNATFLTAFANNGFTVDTSSATNASGSTYVGWQWQAGQGSTSSNTSGSITSTVSVNATAGFSVVTFTGNGTAGATTGHGLGVTPAFVIIKNRTAAAQNWLVWHKSISQAIQTSSVITLNGYTGATLLNSTGGSISYSFDSQINGSTNGMVAYCWAEIAGFSKFTSYTGNGSTDGPFVFTGFRPAFIMIKRTDSTGFWVMLDNKRLGYNVTDKPLYANASNAESTAQGTDFLSNGFKIRATDNDVNTSGGTYIVMAYAENPFKNSNAR